MKNSKNELIVEENWWRKNWKWIFLPTFILIVILSCGVILILTSDRNVIDVAQAYSDNSLYEKAIERAKTNPRVLEIIGEIEPIDKLSILQGNVIYSNNMNSVELSVRVKGNKREGEMDVSADKNGKKWNYKKIKIRVKELKEEILILKDTVD